MVVVVVVAVQFDKYFVGDLTAVVVVVQFDKYFVEE
jgi:hypothetical protein